MDVIYCIISKISKKLINLIYLFSFSDFSIKILDFLRNKTKTSLKFSHLCFWNLLSCKNTYKRINDLPSIQNLMTELMNEWNYIPQPNEKFYISLFHNYIDFDEFCKNNLVVFNNSKEFIKDSKINMDKIRAEIMRTEINTQNRKEKWRYYVSILNYINDIISLSDLLKNIPKDKRNIMLKEVISYINKVDLPINFYHPFGNENEVKVHLMINTDFSFCLSTKSHVPYHLLLELSDEKIENLPNEKVEEEINNGFLESSYEANEENFIQGIIANKKQKSFLDKNGNEIEQSKNEIMNQNKSGGSSFWKYFTWSYYFPNSNTNYSYLSCQSTNESPTLSHQGEDINESKDESMINKDASPDSIGIFGSLKFPDIQKKITTRKGSKTKQILPLIIKGGEDLRQDLFVSQVINIFLSIFKKEKLPIFLQPLNVLSTGRGGIMETIIDTTNLMKINKVDYTQFDGYSSSTLYIEPEIDTSNLAQSSLRNYFIFKYGDGSEEFEKAVSNFVSSLAGYSLLCYLLEIKDRNNGNILINDQGNLIHIDFGFLLSCSPGNVNFERAPFKLTWDFIELMKGINSNYFSNYKNLMFEGLKALRKYYQIILGFVQMFMVTNDDLPCFGDKFDLIGKMKSKFFLNEMDDDILKEKVEILINTSLNNWRTKVYDNYQKFCVGIS